MSTPIAAPADVPSGQSRVERMRQPLSADVLVAVADAHGVCVRPFTMEAADPESAAKARLLLRYGADVNLGTANFDQTPLMSAAGSGSVPLVRLFLKAGAEINHQDRYGETALFQAIQEEHLAVVRVLLEAGADVNLKDHQGQTEKACPRGRSPI